MKVIISHDVDHITAFEHFKELFLPKYLIRITIELFSRKILFHEYCLRIYSILRNKLHNIDELVRYDKENQVKSTFFFALNNGLSLSYNDKNAKRWINYVISYGIPVGVHGIEYNNQGRIDQEFSRFNQLIGVNPSGIRMHYLRNAPNTLNYLERAGYLYDASVYKFCSPYKTHGIWEFPIQIMDSYIISGELHYHVKTLNQAKEDTIAFIERAKKDGLKYLHIVTHDFYFSDSFRSWKAWYIWLIEYLHSNNYDFVDYNEAINQLNEADRKKI